MHDQSVDQWRHPHIFLGQRHDANERRTIFVVLLTTAMMIAEIAGGTIFGSMALIADGWHMSTHAVALGVAAAAYALARRYKNDPRFAFGAGKLGDLAAFASAIILAMIAGFIAYESLTRIGHPVPIAYGEAIVIAALSLAVNLFSAFLLRGGGAERGHSHGRDHGEADGSSHAHSAIFTPAYGGDNNLRAAYLHVLADAATSVAAILGLILAWRLELPVIDPAVGFIGSLVIFSWAFGLLRDCGAVLLDCVPDRQLAEAIRRRLETHGDRVSDLHLWRVGPGHAAVVIGLVSDQPKEPASYKEKLAGLDGLSHVTVEVHACS